MKKQKASFSKIGYYIGLYYDWNIPFFRFTGTIGTNVEKSKAQPHGKSSVPPLPSSNLSWGVDLLHPNFPNFS